VVIGSSDGLILADFTTVLIICSARERAGGWVRHSTSSSSTDEARNQQRQLAAESFQSNSSAGQCITAVDDVYFHDQSFYSLPTTTGVGEPV